MEWSQISMAAREGTTSENVKCGQAVHVHHTSNDIYFKTSDFTNGTNKAKLVNRIRTMLETFDRVAIIIERDRVKGKGKDDKSTTCVSL